MDRQDGKDQDSVSRGVFDAEIVPVEMYKGGVLPVSWQEQCELKNYVATEPDALE